LVKISFTKMLNLKEAFSDSDLPDFIELEIK